MSTFLKTVADYRDAGGTANLGGTSFPNILPSLTLAADTHVRPLLGDTFCDALLAAYAAAPTTPLAAWQTDLLPLIQRAVAHLATPDILDQLQVQVSDAGVQIESSANRKTAFQWQVRALKDGATRKGHGALDRLLTHLEDKIDDAAFAAWATSDAAKAAAELLVNSAAQFQRHVDIRGSRLTFQSLVPLIRKVEAFELEPVLGVGFLAELRELLRARDLAAGTPEHRLVLDFIRPAVAHATLARALRERAFRLSGDTLEMAIFLDDPDTTRQAVAVAAADLLARQQARAEDDARVYLARLLGHLRTTASVSVFPAYFASALYNAGVPVPDPVGALNADTASKIYFGL